ncbi:LacI family DNA-binding transcriptional regulator [Corynebacterium vitaeruminis]|uniref:LacI family DNA-binding transcriptional regulator n=1 Tax=Corynebacterium vitaeruminis TaxID=38305 RepID=UPI0009DE32CE|nr:LacI family DNA-binding transcriptional regulator [Corynebacterium vitaeruminis]
MARRATMKDVAELAGVSIQTVSRVLNSSGSVSDHTREKVEAAARDLRYTINLAAKQLAAKHSTVVGFLVDGELRFGIAEIFGHLQKTVRERHEYLAFATAANEQDQLLDAIDYLQGSHVKGLIVFAPEASMLEFVLARTSLPCVAIAAGVQPRHNMSVVTFDQEPAVYAVTRQLIEGGARRIVNLTGDMHCEDARLRLGGYRRACEDAGIEPDWIVGWGWANEDGYGAAKQMLEKGAPDAIVVGNDDMAIGAMRALREAGLSVPEDVQVIGFDDLTVSRYLSPSLTTIAQNFRELGMQALGELDRLVAGETGQLVTVPTRTIWRETTRIEA